MLRGRSIWRQVAVILAGIVAYMPNIQADTVPEGKGGIRWSGFASVGVSNMSGDVEEYLERFEDGETEYSDTRMGLNISSQLNKETSIAGQILMAGREDEYNAHADWVFVTYKPEKLSNTSFKLGRIKFPTLLNSEIYDVGYAYAWSRTPQEVYDLSALGPQASYEVMSGFNASYENYIGDYDWSIQAFTGEAESGLGNIEDLVGAVLSISHDSGELRIGWHSGNLGHGGGGHAEGLVGELAEHKGEELIGADKDVTNIGINFTLANIQIAAEFVSVDWDGGDEPDETDSFDTDAWYISLGYPMGKWTPMVTFAEMDEEGGTNQESLTLGIRYELNRSTAVKLEWQSIDIDGRGDPLHIENEDGDEFFQSGLAILTEDGTENDISMINFTIDMVF